MSKLDFKEIVYNIINYREGVKKDRREEFKGLPFILPIEKAEFIENQLIKAKEFFEKEKNN